MPNAFNALQIAIRAMHFDEPTTPFMFGYVLGLSQRNIDGPGQLFVSRGSFKVRRDGRAATKDDEVKRWEGDGEVVFSTPLAGLDQVGLDLYFVRDNRRARDFGGVLQDAFGGQNATVQKAVQLIAAALPATGVGGAVVALGPAVIKGFGGLLRKLPDRVKIRAEGSLRVSTLERRFDNPAFTGEIKWGLDHSDKGYFVSDWDLVTMANPAAIAVHPQLPKALTDKIGMM